jgi:hypothetical protein
MRETKRCSAPNCGRPRFGRGWCHKHYMRMVHYGWPAPDQSPVQRDRRCTVSGCTRQHLAKGLCSMHYQRIQNLGWDTPEQRRIYADTDYVY